MKLEVQTYEGKKEVDVVEHIRRRLDGADYDRGELETVRATSENAIEALAVLVDILVEKHILDGQNVTEIANRCREE